MRHLLQDPRKWVVSSSPGRIQLTNAWPPCGRNLGSGGLEGVLDFSSPSDSNYSAILSDTPACAGFFFHISTVFLSLDTHEPKPRKETLAIALITIRAQTLLVRTKSLVHLTRPDS